MYAVPWRLFSRGLGQRIGYSWKAATLWVRLLYSVKLNSLIFCFVRISWSGHSGRVHCHGREGHLQNRFQYEMEKARSQGCGQNHSAQVQCIGYKPLSGCFWHLPNPPPLNASESLLTLTSTAELCLEWSGEVGAEWVGVTDIDWTEVTLFEGTDIQGRCMHTHSGECVC